MRKCLIWGNGGDYETVINQILFEIEKKNITVVGIVARHEDIIGPKYDGFDVIEKGSIGDVEYDYIVITSSRYFEEIRKEIINIGIDSRKIINGQVLKIPHFDFGRYCSLIENPITILSDDCWGGYIYHSLYLQFASPTINTLWDKEDYIKFVSNLRFYLKQDLKMEREGNIRQNLCPIGSLGLGTQLVKVKFVHSYKFEEAKALWDRRLKRINLKNVFVKIAIDAENENALNYIKAFSRVAENKICFYSGDCTEQVLYLERFEKFVKTGTRTDTIKYNDYVRIMDWLMKSIDLLKLLNGEKHCLRD